MSHKLTISNFDEQQDSYFKDLNYPYTVVTLTFQMLHRVVIQMLHCVVILNEK